MKPWPISEQQIFLENLEVLYSVHISILFHSHILRHEICILHFTDHCCYCIGHSAAKISGVKRLGFRLPDSAPLISMDGSRSSLLQVKRRLTSKQIVSKRDVVWTTQQGKKQSKKQSKQTKHDVILTTGQGKKQSKRSDMSREDKDARNAKRRGSRSSESSKRIRPKRVGEEARSQRSKRQREIVAEASDPIVDHALGALDG